MVIGGDFETRIYGLAERNPQNNYSRNGVIDVLFWSPGLTPNLDRRVDDGYTHSYHLAIRQSPILRKTAIEPRVVDSHR